VVFPQGQFCLETFDRIVKDANQLVFALKTTIKLDQMPSNVDKESKITHPLWILKLTNRLLLIPQNLGLLSFKPKKKKVLQHFAVTQPLNSITAHQITTLSY
jgi:hypothetical protein